MSRQGRRNKARRDWHRLTEEFGEESDRGTALVAAALLDSNLEDLLRAFFVADDREAEYLLGTNLQSFGARVRAAYCLGLLSENECHDLRIIKEIRNHFAHHLHVSFEDTFVLEHCRGLRMLRRLRPESAGLSPRQLLEHSACLLSVLLVARREEIAGQRRTLRGELSEIDVNEQCPFMEAESWEEATDEVDDGA